MPHVDATSLGHRTTLTSALAAGLLGALVLVDGALREAPFHDVPPRKAAAAVVEPSPPFSEERVTLVVEPRPTHPRPPEAERRLEQARALGAPGGPIEDPCQALADTLDTLCERTALEPFFRALDELSRADAARHAVVTVLGNSLIAADHIVDVVRLRLVGRFGDGGRGFLLADRQADYGGRTRTGRAASGRWRAHNFSMGERGRFPFGVAGVLHVSRRRGAMTAWDLHGEERARLFYYEHEKSPVLELSVDGRLLSTVQPSGGRAGRSLELALPKGASALSLEAKGKGAVVYGALLERRAPGVIVNGFGVPAADAAHFLSAESGLFAEQLAAQDPSLLVLLLGGNETKRLHWGKRKRPDVERDYGALLTRLREIAPDAACLSVGPIDSVYGGPEKVWRTRTHLSWVIEMQRRVSKAQGCAYFDLFEAMGGPGSLRRFAQQGLLHADMVHPKKGGLDLLGELLADALLDAYERTPRVTRRRTRG